jgi:DNA-binding Lrp family transcriptional regulator
MSTDKPGREPQPRRLAAALDDADRQIVALLRADGRMSMRELAGRVHISRANAYARLERLRDAGVITGFSATIDPERYGYGMAAYVAVKIQQRSWQAFMARIREITEVEHAALVSGDYDILMLVRTADTRSLRDLVLERLQHIPEVITTQTMFILDEATPTRAGTPAAAAR